MSRRMSSRDLEYIENRLMAPCVSASEAHARLRNHTMTHDLAEQANRLMYAMQEFTNTCRDIRQEVVQIVLRD